MTRLQRRYARAQGQARHRKMAQLRRRLERRGQWPLPVDPSVTAEWERRFG